MTQIKNKFNIGDEVYHITPESPKAIVIDWTYHRISGIIIYTVTTGFGDGIQCIESELSEDKIYG